MADQWDLENLRNMRDMLIQLDPRYYQVARFEASLLKRIEAQEMDFPLGRNEIIKLLDGPLFPPPGPKDLLPPHLEKYFPAAFFPVIDMPDFRAKCLMVATLVHKFDEIAGKPG